MPALNFKKRFAPAVESGAKRQTIRAQRRDGRNPMPGQVLSLYTGQRTKWCRKLGEATCSAVDTVAIGRDYLRIGFAIVEDRAERNAFAIADGFGSFDELTDYFEHEFHRDLKAYLKALPWTGVVIYWLEIRSPKAAR